MKWILIYPVLLSFFMGVFGPIEATELPFSGNDFSIDLDQQTTHKSISLENLSLIKILGEVEDNENNDPFQFNYKSTFSQSLPFILTNINGFSLYNLTKATKLFILFHSWKSFLPI